MLSEITGLRQPSRENAAFQIASAAVDEGHQVAMFLELDGTFLVHDPISKNIHGVGLTPVGELWPKLQKAGVPFYV